MKLASDTNRIVARLQNTAKPAAKMECGLEVVSVMNAMNEAVEAYNMGRRSAISDRRFYTANTIINGMLACPVGEADEDKMIETAIRIADKLTRRLDEIEQKEYEEFRKLKED